MHVKERASENGLAEDPAKDGVGNQFQDLRIACNGGLKLIEFDETIPTCVDTLQKLIGGGAAIGDLDVWPREKWEDIVEAKVSIGTTVQDIEEEARARSSRTSTTASSSSPASATAAASSAR